MINVFDSFSDHQCSYSKDYAERILSNNDKKNNKKQDKFEKKRQKPFKLILIAMIFCCVSSEIAYSQNIAIVNKTHFILDSIQVDKMTFTDTVKSECIEYDTITEIKLYVKGQNEVTFSSRSVNFCSLDGILEINYSKEFKSFYLILSYYGVSQRVKIGSENVLDYEKTIRSRKRRSS